MLKVGILYWRIDCYLCYIIWEIFMMKLFFSLMLFVVLSSGCTTPGLSKLSNGSYEEGPKKLVRVDGQEAYVQHGTW